MRKISTKIHLWLSLPFGIIISLICLSGAILVFETELMELCYPSRYFVKEVHAAPLSPDALITSARHQLPDSIRITGLQIPSDPQRTYRIVTPQKKAANFINPYTGEMTSINNGQNFFLATMRLHRWLLEDFKRDGSFSPGKTLVGASTLLMIIIIVSGLILWLPKSRKGLKNRLNIKRTSGWRRFFFDLHVTGGFYSAALLLVLALTGLTWSFSWYRDAFYTLFGVETTQSPSHAHNSSSSKKEKERKKTDYTLWANVASEIKSRYTEYNSITLQDGSATVSTAKLGNTRGSDRYTFDPRTGEITEVQLYKDLPKSGKIRGWIYSVHVGSWGGTATKIITFIAAFLGFIFPITGYYFWIKKIRRKKRR